MPESSKSDQSAIKADVSATSAEGKSPKAKKRGLSKRGIARLAAVQALYQIDLLKGNREAVLIEFMSHRLGDSAEEKEFKNVDRDLFVAIVRGTDDVCQILDQQLEKVLTDDWRLDRLERVLRATLQAGIWELAFRQDVPTQVVINEYVEVAKSFFDGKEPGLVNGILNSLGKERDELSLFCHKAMSARDA